MPAPVRTVSTIGVAVFALRRLAHRTQVLLLRRAAGTFEGQWCPVAGSLRDGEPEAQAALRELREETALEPGRLYATTIAAENTDPALGRTGRIGVFVAFVSAEDEVRLDEEHNAHEWLALPQAAERLPLDAQRRALASVREEFVRRAPDEALRLR
jgi:dATP pyrophosphohydrolase